MKLLVTGGAGYIGSHTAHLLSELGHEIVVLDNLYSGQRWAVPSKVKFIEGDVGDRALLKKVMGGESFDGVLHFAAHIEVAESVADPMKYYRNNVASAMALFDEARLAKIPRLIFSSTAAVYGEPKAELISETAELAPINPYGASKMMAEQILRDLCAASDGEMKCVVLRYFNAAGARRDLQVGQATPRATHLVKIASEVALGLRPSMAIYGTDYPTKDGTCARDYIHIEDLAQAHVDALDYLVAGGASDTFNVGYGRLYTVREVIAMMKRVSGLDFRVIESARRAGDPESLGADSSRIRKLLGWKPQFDSLELICKTAFEWEKKLKDSK